MQLTPQQLNAYIAKARRSPRLNEMFNSFAELAEGTQGKPHTHVQIDPELLKYDQESLSFAKTRSHHAGVFNQHFVASLPYILEEQCRLGAAILRFSRHIQTTQKRPCDIYTLGDGPGVMARALAEHAQGSIRTMCCSPNSENQRVFLARAGQLPVTFYLGPFFDVYPANLLVSGITQFKQGFDLIIEDTTFQMYGRERAAPIQLAIRNLRDDGIFLMLEKFAHTSVDEFERRENQKDIDFKARYFPIASIEAKKLNIVNSMNQQLVTLGEMSNVLSHYFKNSFVTWNSGNFSSLVASNNEKGLKRFISSMTTPAIPGDFLYETLPLRIVGQMSASFMSPSRSTSP